MTKREWLIAGAIAFTSGFITTTIVLLAKELFLG